MTKPKYSIGDGSTDDFYIECTFPSCQQKFLVAGNLNNQPMDLINVVCPYCKGKPILFGLSVVSLLGDEND